MKRILTILFTIFLLCGGVTVIDSATALAQARQRSRKKPVTNYACPMHPEVVSNRPGKCPKCGMALRGATDDPAPAASASVGDRAESGTTKPDSAMSLRVPDIAVLDQNGKHLNFYTDLVKNKTVAINFIFTTCTTICPPLTATFRRVQTDLMEHAGRDVQLISISVDPTVDVPERLQAFAAKFKAGPGWTFVTGEKSEINTLLKALGAATADKSDHTPMILIGNDQVGYWTRAYGLSPPSTLARILAEAANRK